MSAKIRKPIPAKPFCAVMFVRDFDIDGLAADLAGLMGKIDAALPPYEFTYTDYYTPEMGKGLKKAFYGFERLIAPEELPDIKIAVTEIEEKHSIEGRRRVNIDPGYITAAKVVLSTSKDYAHRIYIGRGIYGDVHLQFSKGTWASNPWTYPDYQSADVQSFFFDARSRFMERVRKTG